MKRFFQRFIEKCLLKEGSKVKLEPGSRKGRDQGTYKEKDIFSEEGQRENFDQIRRPGVTKWSLCSEVTTTGIVPKERKEESEKLSM